MPPFDQGDQVAASVAVHQQIPLPQSPAPGGSVDGRNDGCCRARSRGGSRTWCQSGNDQRMFSTGPLQGIGRVISSSAGTVAATW